MGTHNYRAYIRQVKEALEAGPEDRPYFITNMLEAIEDPHFPVIGEAVRVMSEVLKATPKSIVWDTPENPVSY